MVVRYKVKPVQATETDVATTWDEFGIDRCGCRRHWSGELVNIFSIVGRKASESDTEHFMKECARSLAREVIENGDQFGPEDRFQLVIGWPKAIREHAWHTIKTGGTFEDLRKIAVGVLQVAMRHGWSTSVLSENSPSEQVCFGQAHSRFELIDIPDLNPYPPIEAALPDRAAMPRR